MAKTNFVSLTKDLQAFRGPWMALITQNYSPEGPKISCVRVLVCWSEDELVRSLQ